MKRNGYRKQKACANCKSVVVKGLDCLCCSLGVDKCPPKPNKLMGQREFKLSCKEDVRLRDAWDRLDKWVNENQVQPHGICDKWTDKEA